MKKMKIKLLLMLFIGICLATIGAYAQGLDSLLTGETPTNESVSKFYTIWFTGSGVFLMAVIFLTGKLVAIINKSMSDAGKQYLSWAVGAVLGLIGGLFHLGQFATLDITNSIILGLVYSGFANWIYNSGAFNATSKVNP